MKREHKKNKYLNATSSPAYNRHFGSTIQNINFQVANVSDIIVKINTYELHRENKYVES